MKSKKADDSRTVMTELVLSSHVNGSGRLFGGQLMSWMDIAGAVCARRHSGCEVVTASATDLNFYLPAVPNDLIVITAELEDVGNTSMKVRITVEVEEFGGEEPIRRKTCGALFTYVALGPDGSKRRVPRLERIEKHQTAETV